MLLVWRVSPASFISSAGPTQTQLFYMSVLASFLNLQSFPVRSRDLLMLTVRQTTYSLKIEVDSLLIALYQYKLSTSWVHC
jgi:hypothetical protein